MRATRSAKEQPEKKPAEEKWVHSWGKNKMERKKIRAQKAFLRKKEGDIWILTFMYA